ncbi:hypothetical protein IWX91DRAFT_334105 [Phyllosticta citricarpa]
MTLLQQLLLRLLTTAAWFSSGGTAAALRRRRRCTNLWARSGRARRRSVALVFGKVHMLPHARTSAGFFCLLLVVVLPMPVAVGCAPRVVASGWDHGCIWIAASGDDIDVGGRATGLEFELQGAGRLFILSRGDGASVVWDGRRHGAEALCEAQG